MAEMFPNQPPEPSDPVSPVESRMSGSEHDRGFRGPWIGGAILILLGLIFLLRNFGIAEFNNWWALFILIPAVGSLLTAWNIFQHNGGRVSGAVRGPLIGGLILLMVAATFLLNLNWSMIWPAFLIIVGVGALISGFARD